MDLYNKKHAFISTANFHVINLLLNLIQRDIIEKSKLILIIDSKSDRGEEIINTCKANNITAFYWDEIKTTSQKFLTLNSISLQLSLAEIIVHCLNHNFITAGRTSILITDDEVTRWLNLYNNEGRLRVSKLAKIDNNVLKILNIVNNYITPYNSWGKYIESITGRKLNIIDAVIPFSAIDYNSQETIKRLVSERAKHRVSESCKVLLFTQPRDQRQTFNIVKGFLTKELEQTDKKPIVLGLWLHLNAKGLLYLSIIKILIKLKKLSITIKLEQKVSHEHYAMMLYDYDYLILQARGGFSTAKYFSENIGKVLTLKNSPNDQTLKLDYGVRTFSFDSFEDALKSALTSIQPRDDKNVLQFTQSLSKKNNDSLTILKKYWNSFQ